jgi:hypothetical protein
VFKKKRTRYKNKHGKGYKDLEIREAGLNRSSEDLQDSRTTRVRYERKDIQTRKEYTARTCGKQ